MKNIKNEMKYVGISLLVMLIGIFLISTLYYFDVLSSGFVRYFRIFFMMFVLFISGYLLGKKTEKKGYMEGLKLGLISVLLFFVISLIFFRSDIKLRLLFYDIILIFTSTFGSMLGISKNKG